MKGNLIQNVTEYVLLTRGGNRVRATYHPELICPPTSEGFKVTIYEIIDVFQKGLNRQIKSSQVSASECNSGSVFQVSVLIGNNEANFYYIVSRNQFVRFLRDYPSTGSQNQRKDEIGIDKKSKAKISEHREDSRTETQQQIDRPKPIVESKSRSVRTHLQPKEKPLRVIEFIPYQRPEAPKSKKQNPKCPKCNVELDFQKSIGVCPKCGMQERYGKNTTAWDRRAISLTKELRDGLRK